MHNMDPMKKGKKMQAFPSMYMSILDEIKDDQLEDEDVREYMGRRYKDAKKDNRGQSLWSKYQAELTNVKLGW